MDPYIIGVAVVAILILVVVGYLYTTGYWSTPVVAQPNLPTWTNSQSPSVPVSPDPNSETPIAPSLPTTIDIATGETTVIQPMPINTSPPPGVIPTSSQPPWIQNPTTNVPAPDPILPIPPPPQPIQLPPGASGNNAASSIIYKFKVCIGGSEKPYASCSGGQKVNISRATIDTSPQNNQCPPLSSVVYAASSGMGVPRVPLGTDVTPAVQEYCNGSTCYRMFGRDKTNPWLYINNNKYRFPQDRLQVLGEYNCVD